MHLSKLLGSTKEGLFSALDWLHLFIVREIVVTLSQLPERRHFQGKVIETANNQYCSGW